MVGELETGLSIYYRELQENPNLSIGDQAMYLANVCFMYWIDADLVSILKTCENTLNIAMDHRISEAITFSLYFSGIVCYHQNNLQSAEEKLVRMVEDFYMYMQMLHIHGSFCLSLIYQAQGQPDKARERNRKMMEYAIDTDNQMVLRTIEAFEAELALRQGRLSEASNWAKRFHPKPFMPPIAFYMPQLTLVKILLAQDTTDSRRRAADLLAQLNDFLASIHYKKSLIEVLAFQALLQDTLGERPVALEKAAKAIALAEQGGFIRLFVDLGPQMADLLQRLHKQNVAVDYIEKLLAAFRDDEQVLVQDVSESQASLALAASQQLSEDPLTNREVDVLELLAQRLQNKEIAKKLTISPETVKGHLKNMYRKLQVRNRGEAVDKARGLGILSRR
jgi:LuxR family maltose regulon positive regulatory protein